MSFQPQGSQQQGMFKPPGPAPTAPQDIFQANFQNLQQNLPNRLQAQAVRGVTGPGALGRVLNKSPFDLINESIGQTRVPQNFSPINQGRFNTFQSLAGGLPSSSINRGVGNINEVLNLGLNTGQVGNFITDALAGGLDQSKIGVANQFIQNQPKLAQALAFLNQQGLLSGLV
jgi:hypothetical protein